MFYSYYLLINNEHEIVFSKWVPTFVYVGIQKHSVFIKHAQHYCGWTE